MSRDLILKQLRHELARKAEEFEFPEPTIMPPWPDEFMRRLMDAVQRFEGRPFVPSVFAQMLAAVTNVTWECSMAGILGPDAECFEAEQDGAFIIAVRDRSIADINLTLKPNFGFKPARRSAPQLPGPMPRLGRDDT